MVKQKPFEFLNGIDFTELFILNLLKNRKTVHVSSNENLWQKKQINKSKPQLLDFIQGRRYEIKYYRKKMQRTTVNLLRNEEISN